MEEVFNITYSLSSDPPSYDSATFLLSVTSVLTQPKSFQFLSFEKNGKTERGEEEKSSSDSDVEPGAGKVRSAEGEDGGDLEEDYLNGDQHAAEHIEESSDDEEKVDMDPRAKTFRDVNHVQFMDGDDDSQVVGQGM